MLKIKAITLGIIAQIIFLSISFSIITLFSLKIGDIAAKEYLLAFELAFTFSVGLSAFISARIAWSKAFVYGIIMAVFALILRLIVALIFSAEINFTTLMVKFLILLAMSTVCSVLGVTIKRKSKF